MRDLKKKKRERDIQARAQKTKGMHAALKKLKRQKKKKANSKKVANAPSKTKTEVVRVYQSGMHRIGTKYRAPFTRLLSVTLDMESH